MYQLLTTESYERANKLKEQLIARGVPEEAISILINAHSNDANLDVSQSALKNTDKPVTQAPNGTISAYGATFTILAGVTSGVLIAVSGPLAAIIGGAAVASGGIATVLSGLGVPEEKYSHYEALLERGDVLVAVEDQYAEIARSFA